jgi:hypothetical protein
MPRGPKGEKRPAGVIGAAIRVEKIAKGEVEDAPPPTTAKTLPPKALGAKGGRARAKATTPERRAEIARNAAAKRWGC